MRIFFVLNWYGWWGKNFEPDVLDREDAGSFAGGETHMLEGALGLAEAGHRVTVFSDLIRPSKHRDVEFRALRDYLRVFFYAEKPDVVLSYMQPGPLSAAPLEAVRIFVQQCNDLGYAGPWQGHTDAIIAASASHAAFLGCLYDPPTRAPLYPGPFEVVHNGCYVERYPERPKPPQERQPIVGYWSSPDRGLHHILDAWPYVLKLRPDAKLRVHYEINRIFTQLYSPVTGSSEMNPIQARLLRLQSALGRSKAYSSIHFTGMQARPVLRRAQLETRVMCYPLDPALTYTEGMGSSVSEAMAAGALPLLQPRDCFPSVYTGPARWIEGDTASRSYAPQLATQIAKALDWDGTAPSMETLRAGAERWSWTNARKEYVRVIERCIARKLGETIPEPAFPLEST